MAFFSKEKKSRGPSDEAKQAYLQYLGTGDRTQRVEMNKRKNQGSPEVKDNKKTTNESHQLIQSMPLSEIHEYVKVFPYQVDWSGKILYFIGKCAGNKIVLHTQQKAKPTEYVTIVPRSLLDP